MFNSRVIRLIGLVATLAVATVSLHTATAGAVPNNTMSLSAGVCYQPKDVAYGGVSPYISTPSFQVTNSSGRTLMAREWLIVIDFTTGKQVKYRWVGDQTLVPGSVTTYAQASIDLSFRTPSNFFWAAARVELDLYSNGALFSILTGVPSSYRLWDNSGFVTYHDTGRNQASVSERASDRRREGVGAGRVGSEPRSRIRTLQREDMTAAEQSDRVVQGLLHCSPADSTIGAATVRAYGFMFWLMWKRLSGSYFRLTSTN